MTRIRKCIWRYEMGQCIYQLRYPDKEGNCKPEFDYGGTKAHMERLLGESLQEHMEPDMYVFDEDKNQQQDENEISLHFTL